MPERKYSATSGYRYGFNGKENDDEVKGDRNIVDFGARIHDSRIGRFFSTDILANKTPAYTPYHYGGNNPVFYIDNGGNFKIKYNVEALRKFGCTKQEIIRFENIVKNIGSLVKDNPNVLDAISNATGLSKEQILKDVEFGKGPTIEITEYGLGARGGKSGITLDIRTIRNLENINFEDKDKLAEQVLGVALTVLHEYGHYGDEKTNDKLTGQFSIVKKTNADGGTKTELKIDPNLDGTPGKQNDKWSYSGHRGDDIEIIGFGVTGYIDTDYSVKTDRATAFGPEKIRPMEYPSIPANLPANAQGRTILKTLKIDK